jgi:hypothetical protein
MNHERRPAVLLLSLLLLLSLAACDASVTEAPTAAPTQPSRPAAYPAPGTPTPFVYPAPEDLSGRVRIAIDRPVNAGETQVSGVGPEGLTVRLVNMTTVGGVAGETRIGADGTFVIETDPLPAGVRIGIVVDLEEAGLTEDDIIPGEGEFSMPRVGYAVDTVVIPQP